MLTFEKLISLALVVSFVNAASVIFVEKLTNHRVPCKAERLAATLHALYILSPCDWFGMTPHEHMSLSCAYFCNELVTGRGFERVHGLLCFAASWVALQSGPDSGVFGLLYNLMWLEASTPFLHLTWWSLTEKCNHGAVVFGDLCVALFFIVRIVWQPWLMYHAPPLPWFGMPIFVVFYALNLYWFRLLVCKRAAFHASLP